MLDRSNSNDKTVSPGLPSASSKRDRNTGPKWGLIVGGLFGVCGIAIMAIATPFVIPAFRKHCLPYVPATDTQVENLREALRKYSKRGGSFLDVGSGDGRICRMAADMGTLDPVHGVELNSILVTYSRLSSMASRNQRKLIKYYRQDLWRFPLHDYDSVCIFGVESMMLPLEEFILSNRSKPQKIFACRFPFAGLKQISEFGEGIDTVWIYELGGCQKRVMT